jgi:hypothetical protein
MSNNFLEYMPKFFGDAVNEIDAGIFSGDVLLSEDTLAAFEFYLGRWNRAAAGAKDFLEECEEDDIL